MKIKFNVLDKNKNESLNRILSIFIVNNLHFSLMLDYLSEIILEYIDQSFFRLNL